MAIFGPKPWVNPFGKMSIFDFLNFLFLQPRNAFFRSRISLMIFSWPILPKKKVGKMAIFGPKQWVNPFEKMSIFPVFELLYFYSLERRFFVLEYRKRHFPGLYCLKKKLEKWQFLDQNHGLTPFEKCQFFDILNFLFLQPRKAFFRSRIS